MACKDAAEFSAMLQRNLQDAAGGPRLAANLNYTYLVRSRNDCIVENVVVEFKRQLCILQNDLRRCCRSNFEQ